MGVWVTTQANKLCLLCGPHPITQLSSACIFSCLSLTEPLLYINDFSYTLPLTFYP